MKQLTYTGGISPVSLIFIATGRTLVVRQGETLDLLPNEAETLEGRPDFADLSEGPLLGPPIPTLDSQETPS